MFPENDVAVTTPVMFAPAPPVINPPTYNLSPTPTPPLTTNAGKMTIKML